MNVDPDAAQTHVEFDEDELSIRFASGWHQAIEGGTAAQIEIVLSEDPGRTLDIPIKVFQQAWFTRDLRYVIAPASAYTISPTTVTFEAGDTRKTFTVTAVDNYIRHSRNRWIHLGFGSLPQGVNALAGGCEQACVGPAQFALWSRWSLVGGVGGGVVAGRAIAGAGRSLGFGFGFGVG